MYLSHGHISSLFCIIFIFENSIDFICYNCKAPFVTGDSQLMDFGLTKELI